MTDEVAKRSTRSNELMLSRELTRTLLSGTDAMRAAGEKFTPRHQGESVADYKSRLDNAHLFRALGNAIDAQVGKVFSKPVALNEDSSAKMQEWSKNVDGMGRGLMAFTVDAFWEAMADGVSFIMVDMPALPPGASLADQKAINATPTLMLIRADAILGWRTKMIGSEQVVTQLRLYESSVVPDGEYGDKVEERVRVFTLPDEGGTVTFTVFVKKQGSTKSEWVEDPGKRGVTTFTRIPLYPIYTNRTGFLEGEPTLSALAELNLEHWISSSEQRRALSFLRFAMLYLSGITGDASKIKVSPNTVVKLPQGGSAGYIEHSGAGVGSGFTDIERIEKRMQDVGMQLRIEGAGTVTATAAAIDSSESNAALKASANIAKETLQSVIEMVAKIGNMGAAGKVTMDVDFDDRPNSADFSEVLKMEAMGLVSKHTVIKEAKRRNILGPSYDSQEDMERVLEESPPPAKDGAGALPPEQTVTIVKDAGNGVFTFERRPKEAPEMTAAGGAL